MDDVEFRVLKVGEPFEPDVKEWPAGTRVSVDMAGLTFAMFHDEPSAAELKSMHEGRVLIRLMTMPHTLLFLLRLGDAPWMDAPFSVHKLPEEARVCPADPGPGHTWILTLAMVDTSTGVIRGMRQTGMSRNFSRAILKAFEEQKTRPADDAAHVSEVMATQKKEPAALAAEAVDRFEQGETAN